LIGKCNSRHPKKFDWTELRRELKLENRYGTCTVNLNKLVNMDLVQIRWQQIRSAEALQLVESENIALKKEIAFLRDKSALLAHEASQSELKRKQALLTSDERISINAAEVGGVKSVINDIRSDLSKLKLQWVDQLSWLSSQSNLLRESCRSFESHLSLEQKEVEKLDREKKIISKELDSTKQTALLGKRSLHEKIAQLEEKIAKSDADLRVSEECNLALLTQLEEGKALVEVHVREKLVVEYEKEELRRTMDVMQRRMDQLIADNSIVVADLNNSAHLLRMNYEKVLSFSNERTIYL